ncbi:MAG: hypothetical protein ACE5IG_02210 [Dehalococcoidia bacterium]
MRSSATNHRAHVLRKTPGEVTQEILQRYLHAGRGFWTVVVVLAVLFTLGIIGFLIRLQDGLEDRLPWGYYAATFTFLLITVQAAPLASIAFRLARNDWRRPLARASELYAAVGLLTILMFIPLLLLLPSAEGRSTIWFKSLYRDGWPLGAPHAWDFLALLFLVVLGLGLLYTAALPDLATVRDHATGARRRLMERLSLSWRGTPRQWAMLKAALGVLGAFYFMFLIFTITLISSDFGLSLVPGWKDSIFPPYQALAALQSAVAVMLITMFILRNVGGFKEYLGLDQFWALAKILLALSLLWAYFWWAGFLTFWYGRTTAEQTILELLMFGPYAVPFILAFVFCFIVPFLSLVSNPVRKSILGPTLVASSVLLGNLFNQIRIYVASFSIEDVTAGTLERVPAGHPPDAADILIILGGLAGAILLYLLATRLVPVLSMWEVKEGVHLRVARTFMGREVTMLAKPD